MSNTSAEPRRYQCRHIFTDGRRCGSPSLRGKTRPPQRSQTSKP